MQKKTTHTLNQNNDLFSTFFLAGGETKLMIITTTGPNYGKDIQI